MFKIAEKYPLNTSKTIYRVSIEAPLVAKAAKPGQFAIFRLDEFGERFPLTIADYDPEVGTVSFNFQPAGKSTQMFSLMDEGDYIADIVGPLGRPAEIDPNAKRVCVVGGGTGCAINYPSPRSSSAWHRRGHGLRLPQQGHRHNGGRVRAACDNLYICTDDGSYGEKGFVTVKLKELIESGVQYDSVLTCGPVIMMKNVAEVTRPYGIKTNASLNPIMIDGTGMCGGCRLSVAGERKFACVDGPEFDAHLVDWDSLLERNSFYTDEEAEENEHICRITGGVRRGEIKPVNLAETEENPAKRMDQAPHARAGPRHTRQELQRGRAGILRPGRPRRGGALPRLQETLSASRAVPSTSASPSSSPTSRPASMRRRTTSSTARTPSPPSAAASARRRSSARASASAA